MNKKIIVAIVVIVVLIIGFISLKFISLGTDEKMMGASLVTLEVPKLSSIKSECCEYSVTLKTIRGKSVIEKELEGIMEEYEKISCNNKTYYYDRLSNITILDYKVNGGFIFNTFDINYTKGNYCQSL